MKTCVVFGVGSGLGLSLIKKYDLEGYQTVAISRNESKLRELLDSNDLKNTKTFSIDASNINSVRNGFEKITKSFPEIDTFIYNAAAMDGLGSHGLFHEIEIEKFNADFQASVGSAFLAAQIVLKGMKRRKNGNVLFTGGGLALYPNASWGTLSMGKIGVRGLTQLLHEELRPLDIHVGTVTIAGMIGSNERFHPDQIARTFFDFHKVSEGNFEIVYR
jgi:short-subunit dehydrogenase